MSLSEQLPDAAEPEDERLPRPWLTYAFLIVFAVVYLGEATLQAGTSGGFLDPTIQTLVAWGGMSRNLIFERQEWFRLLTAAFLHGGLIHLAMNSLAFFIAGAALEPFIGRLWFAALFFIGAVCGSLASIQFNAPNIVSVGASGAIMGLFGFFLTIAFRFEKGPVRKAFIANSLGTLLPSTLPALLPAVTGGSGFSIDYAAHGGGAVGGAMLGLLFAWFWRIDRRFPPWLALAATITLVSTGVLGWGVKALHTDFSEHSFTASLLPDDKQPKTDDEAKRRADELIADYPNDPRGYFYKALALSEKNDIKAMEAQGRMAVERAERYPGVFRDRFRARVRMVHALSLAELGRKGEARTVAAPVCRSSGEADVVAILKKEDLCG